MDQADIRGYEHPRFAERRSRISQERIALALDAKLELTHLNRDEQEQYFDQLEVLMDLPTPAEEEFFADRRRRGVGVGMDEAGNIVHEVSTRSP